MEKYYGGNDLYEDLFLNQNREIYIKMLLLDVNEPEITEFYIKSTDVVDGKAATIAIPKNDYIYSGDAISTNATDIRVAQNCTISSFQDFIDTFNRTFTGKKNTNFVTLNNTSEVEAGMLFITSFPFFFSSKIKKIDGNNIIFESFIPMDVTSPESCSITSYYTYVKPSNFFVNDIQTIYKQQISKWGLSGGTYYKTNDFNKLIVSNKEIQGYVATGSLKVDGNSPMRRTIDFTCIVDREFGTSADLQLHDFDNKKIKVLIGVKDGTSTKYDYTTYFSDNGTQEDVNGIVWFKMGVFYPRNVSIRHSTDSYSISVTAQDKLSSLDGSFGGMLGEGIAFKDPISGENTGFYDTVLDSFSRYTKEPSDKINIKFADDFSIFKFSPSKTNYALTYVTKGSTALMLRDGLDLFPGMEIEAPGVYKGTKVSYLGSAAGYSIAYMDYPAYETYDSGEVIYKNGKFIYTGATFSFPSYKNFFAIQPLSSIENAQGIFFKGATIAFKGSTYTYNVFTTMANWLPTTWGTVGSNFQKAYYKTIFETNYTYFSGNQNINRTITGAYAYYEPAGFYKFYNVNRIEYTTSEPHGLSVGMKVTISGINYSAGGNPIYGTTRDIYNITELEVTSISSTTKFVVTVPYSQFYSFDVPTYVSGGAAVVKNGAFTSDTALVVGDILYSPAKINDYTNLYPNTPYKVIALQGAYGVILSRADNGENVLPPDVAATSSLEMSRYNSTSSDMVPADPAIGTFWPWIVRYNKYKDKFWITRDNRTGAHSTYIEQYDSTTSSILYELTNNMPYADVTFTNTHFFTGNKFIWGFTYASAGVTFVPIEDDYQYILLEKQDQPTNLFTYQSIVGQNVGLKNGNPIYVNQSSVSALQAGAKYIVRNLNTTNRTFSLEDLLGNVITISATQTSPLNTTILETADYIFGPFSDNIINMERNDDGVFYILRSQNGVERYIVPPLVDDGTGNPTKISNAKHRTTLERVSSSQLTLSSNPRLMRIDSNSNAYLLTEMYDIDLGYNGFLTKLDRSLGIINSITFSDFWESIIPEFKKVVRLPYIDTLTIDDANNVYIVTNGLYIIVDGGQTVYKQLKYNLITVDTETLLPKIAINFNPLNADFFRFEMSDTGSMFYCTTGTSPIKYYTVPITIALSGQDVNSFKELAPQPDNTIVKSSSDNVARILEDIKSQLGVYQYYYDFDGNFNLKEDKRLSFNDPNLDKINPYIFNYDNYNINVPDLPISFDFIKNNNVIADYSNTVDLSTFKNDFLIYGAKKKSDSAQENTPIPIFYHLILDDLNLKNVGTGYLHPWQQYIIDQGIAASATYANFIYFKELKQFFEFKPSRIYNPNSGTTYVTGEFILVEAKGAAGASSSASFNLYEVIKGGTTSYDSYPIKRDGFTNEYLNKILPNPETGFAVRFYATVSGSDYYKFQGIYSKIYDSSSSDRAILTEGRFIYNNYVDPNPSVGGNTSKKIIYRVEDITFTNASNEIEYFSEERPISINLNALIRPSLGADVISSYKEIIVSEGINAELGGPSSCTVRLKAVGAFDPGIMGVFRSDNVGEYKKDFTLDFKDGNPMSWSYYFDVVNLTGSYKVDSVSGGEIPVGIQSWAPSTYYAPGTFVYSDNKIYEALVGGTSGGSSIYAPTGYGDENHLIRDMAGAGGKLIWHLNQISINFEQMKVSKIGSRKNSIFDKDINTLFAPKESLAYFKKSGFYLFILPDSYGYENYSVSFHNRLELMIRELALSYPNIKLVFVPQSQIKENFILNKNTTLKDAFSTLKRIFFLNFVNGQSVSFNSIPIYNMEPLSIIKVSDESADLFGSFLLTDYSLPLSNEGLMMMNAVKTHPYNDENTLLLSEIYTNPENLSYTGSPTSLNGDTVYGG